MKITKGVIATALKVAIYGPEGIGKTTFASKFPKPLFIDTEGSTKHIDVARLDPPTSWELLKEQVRWVLKKKPCKTLVIDSADWAEKMAKDYLVKKNGWESIETPGYGKGFNILAEEWGRFLNLLTEVVDAGINVVLVGHAQIKKFEQPDEMGAYDRWELKLDKRTAAMTKEWVDLLLFANYKTIVITDSKTKSKKASGGERVMYTTHHPAWDAKNRMALPDMLPLGFEGIEHLFENETEPVEPVQSSEPEEKTSLPESLPVSVELPKDLADLLSASGYDIETLERAVGPAADGGLGYMPGDMKAADYPEDFCDFIVSSWDEVKGRMDKLGPFDIGDINELEADGQDLPFTI